MARDKQLENVSLDAVIEKRRLDQALNAKEFAVLAGISYSAARSWFKLPGFPSFCGVVFWKDFETWRNFQKELTERQRIATVETGVSLQSASRSTGSLPSRASKLLSEAG